ncbi:hypothetical protein CYMTET_19879 [Cymbomonas tetramitiformis]|uniref:Uncharacterized protein n=1 Tax=Cymbomonas tetramitiformis TaxID=36881 RepID=A0AAE0G566_9CHLO|nr:hypothetical protein CYMTET_19879 [Cymbomonas tetramitiformis]
MPIYPIFTANFRLHHGMDIESAIAAKPGEDLVECEIPIQRKSTGMKKLAKAKRKLAFFMGVKTGDITMDTLDEYMKIVGRIFGVDPSKWELAAGQNTTVTEENGYKVTRVTGMYWGLVLHLYNVNLFYDKRMKPPEVKEGEEDEFPIDFSEPLHAVQNDTAWKKLIADQPWSPATRRAKTSEFLAYKLRWQDEKEPKLQYEGAHGLWELFTNKEFHQDFSDAVLATLVPQVTNPRVTTAVVAIAAVWSANVSSTPRRSLAHAGCTVALLEVLKKSLAMKVPAEGEKLEKGMLSAEQRDLLQGRALGALATSVVDRQCRKLLMEEDPKLNILFKLTDLLEGYDAQYTEWRRMVAGQAIANICIRDASVRLLIVQNGAFKKVLALVKSEGPSALKLKRCAAAILTQYAIDDEAMKELCKTGTVGPMVELAIATMDEILGMMEKKSFKDATEFKELTHINEGMAYCLWGGCYGLGVYELAEGTKLSMASAQQIAHLGVRAKHCDHVTIKEGMNSDTCAVSFAIACSISCLTITNDTARLVMGGEDKVDDLGSAATLLEMIAFKEEYDDEGLIRAAAITGIALICTHPKDQKGDDCFFGYYRVKLLKAGAFHEVMAAMSYPASNPVAHQLIGECGAVAMMLMSTMATSEIEPWMLEKLLEFLEGAGSAKVAEHLMVAFWILMRNPYLRAQLKKPKKKLKRSTTAKLNSMDELGQDAQEITEADLDKQTKGEEGGEGEEKPAEAEVEVVEEEEDWGLKVLVSVGDKWMPKLLAAKKEDQMTIVKMFEFMLTSLWLYLVEDEADLPPRRSGLAEMDHPKNVTGETWWAVDIPQPEESLEGKTQILKALHLLVNICDLPPLNKQFSKMVQISASALWNFSARSRAVEKHILEHGLAEVLLKVAAEKFWVDAARDIACSFLAHLCAEWANIEIMRDDIPRRFITVMVAMVKSRVPRLEACALRVLGHQTYVHPYSCPAPKKWVSQQKDALCADLGIEALSQIMNLKFRRCAGIDTDPKRSLKSLTTSILVTGSLKSIGDVAKESEPEGSDADYITPREEGGAPRGAGSASGSRGASQGSRRGKAVEPEVPPEDIVEEVMDVPSEDEMGDQAVLAHGLRVMRNLSIRAKHQVHIAKAALMVVLKISTYYAQMLVDVKPPARLPDLDVANLASGVLQNIASHPDNRTRFYKAELRGTTGALVNSDLPSGTISSQKSRGGLSTSLRSELGRQTWPALRNASPTSSPSSHTLGSPGSVSEIRPKVKFPAIKGAINTRNPGDELSGTDSTQRLSQKKSEFLKWMKTTFSDPDCTSAIRRVTGGIPAAFQRMLPQEDATSLPEMSDQVGPVEEWVEDSRHALPNLNTNLRRPLSHLWELTEETKKAEGSKRWCPAISEYQEPSQNHPLPSVADKLLLTTLPQHATRDLSEAVMKLHADPQTAKPILMMAAKGAQEVEDGSAIQETPEMGLPEAVVLERPSTRERDNGRMAVTMLGPQTVDPLGKEEALDVMLDEPKEEEPMALRVAVGPKRPRTNISFRTDVFEHDQRSARLAMFEHIDGSRVYEGLFPEYHLPNGHQTHYYFTTGGMVDEVEVSLRKPPARPNNMAAALQNAIPVDVVLDKVAKPPGPYGNWLDMYKPVPPRPPMPDCHTLDVKDDKSLNMGAFGDLKETPISFMVITEKVTKKDTQETRVKIEVHVPRPATPKEPWTLPKSIFRHRLKECDSKAFFDTQKTMDKMFELDWERLQTKEKLMSMLTRENKTSYKRMDDATMMKELYKILKKYFPTVYSTHLYYSSLGSGNPFLLQLNAYTTFLENTKIPDSEAQFCKKSDCDTCFIVCNYMEKKDKDSTLGKANDDHSLMRYEFTEALIRLAILKFGKDQKTTELLEAIVMLFEECILPNIPVVATTDSNEFRRNRLYCEEVDTIFKKNEKLLRAIYSCLRLPPKSGGVRRKLAEIDGWDWIAGETNVIDDDFTLPDMKNCYLYSRMAVIDEVNTAKIYSLSFIDFLEAIGRLADCKFLPSGLEIYDAGFAHWFEWQQAVEANDPEKPTIPRRASAGWSEPKTRPLYEKVEAYLDILFRKLYYDPAKPDDEYTYDACLSLMKKRDKNLGP